MLRQMVVEKERLGILLLPGKHTAIHFFKKKEKKDPLEFAAAIGVDPIVSIASCHNGPLEENEFNIAGALRGESLELVKCETVDIEVPATAELVIEGKIIPGETCKEGPFGEFSGWFAPETSNNPPAIVTCVTHRKNPIFQGLYEGKPPQEDSTITTLTFSASIFSGARENCPGLVSYTKNPYGSGFFMGAAAIRKMFPGHAKHAMHAIWGTQAGKYQKFLIVVDEEINIHDMREVVWAMCTRCRPDRDIHIETDSVGSVLDPSMWPKTGISGKVMIDATEKWEEEGNAPLSERQKVISHEKSPYWKTLGEKSLSEYLGVDMSAWEKQKLDT
jgi:4-hydroxy-3-polyprenylbenzoate decarboxylase